METTRRQVPLHLILYVIQNLLMYANVTKTLGNSDHAATCFNLFRHVPSKFENKNPCLPKGGLPSSEGAS